MSPSPVRKDGENLPNSFEALSNFRGLVLGITRNTNSRFSQCKLSLNVTMLYSEIHILSGHPLLSGGIAHYVSNVSSHDILIKSNENLYSERTPPSPPIVTTINFLLTKSILIIKRKCYKKSWNDHQRENAFIFLQILSTDFLGLVWRSVWWFFFTCKKESGIKTWRCCGDAFKFYFLSGNITKTWLWLAYSLNGFCLFLRLLSFSNTSEKITFQRIA